MESTSCSQELGAKANEDVDVNENFEIFASDDLVTTDVLENDCFSKGLVITVASDPSSGPHVTINIAIVITNLISACTNI